MKWAAFTALLVAFDGLVGLAVAIVVGVALTFGQPPRRLILAGAAVLALVPIAVLIHGLPSASSVTPDYVLDDRIASHLAFAGLALFATGLIVTGLREREPAPVEPPPEPSEE